MTMTLLSTLISTIQKILCLSVRQNLQRAVVISLDLQLDWKPSPNLGLHIDVKDLYGYIDWKAAPHTEVDASSSNKSFDEESYVEFKPVMSGWESYRDFRQTLNPFLVDYSVLDKRALIYNANITRYTYFWGVGAQQDFFGEQQISFIYYPDIRTLELAYSGPFVVIKLAADSTSLADAHVWHIQANLNYWY